MPAINTSLHVSIRRTKHTRQAAGVAGIYGSFSAQNGDSDGIHALLYTFVRPQMEMKIAELLVTPRSQRAGDGSQSWVSSGVPASLLH